MVNTTNPVLPTLLKRQESYKLIIPAKVEEKIRYLIRKFPHTEWSGILFCSHQGSFEDNNLVITCEDIFPMDLGTSGWTEFKMSPDVVGYMSDHPELFNCSLQLIHSHHVLTAFFSGQDISTLQEEGNNTNCFVSLIVDTPGNYVAAVTRKVKSSFKVTTENISSSYEFFGDGSVNCGNTTPKTETIDKEIIEYFMLDIEKEAVPNPLSYLDDRFDEIEKAKKEAAKTITQPVSFITTRDNKTLFDFLPDDKKFLEDDSEDKSFSKYLTEKDTGMYRMEKEWAPDPELIHAAVIKMIVCSLTISTEKFDLKSWTDKHMDRIYTKMFSTTESYAFGAWAEFIVPYTVDNFEDPSMPPIETSEYQQAVASALIEELYKYSCNNWIEEYIQNLETYL